MKKILPYICLMISLNGMSQIIDSPFYPQSIKSNGSFKLYGDLSANSNTFNNQFLSAINQSQYLDSESKSKQIDLLEEINYFGQIRHFGFEGILKNKRLSSNSYFVFGIQHQYFSEAKLNDDIIKLALLGNKDFLGETITIPELRYSSMYFNQLNFGMIHIIENNNNLHQFGWKVNLNLGQNFNKTEINNSSFYTSADGDRLDLVIDMQMLRSDTAWHEIYNFSGYGLSADLFYSININKKFYLKARIGNLGMISWSAYPIENRIDTSFSFTGVEIDTSSSSQGINHPLLNFSFNESNEFVEFSELGSFITAIPVEFELSTGLFYANQKLYSGIRFFYYPNTISKPLFEVLTTYNLNNSFRFTPVISYGGYGGLNAGIRFGWNINAQWSILAGSTYISSMINSNKGKGSGGIFQVSYKL